MIFSVIIIGAGSFYSDLSSSYNSTGNNNMSSYSQQTYISSIASTSENETRANTGGLTQITFSDLGELIFTAPFKILSSFMDSINSLISAFNSLIVDLGLPGWLIPFIVSFITLIVIFAIINAIWKKEI